MNSAQKPSVSVVIPVYNAEAMIAGCLVALENQSYSFEKYEIILVDDGSTDNTAAIAQGFPVRYHYQSNQGPAIARNQGAFLASGEIILFTDSDCIADRRWIEEMEQSLEDPEVSGVMGAYKGSHLALWSRFSQVEFEERYERMGRASTIDMVATYSAGYRKIAFDAVGGFDGKFPTADNEDTDLSYRLHKAGYKLSFNPRANVFHLGHPSSLRRYAKIKFWRGYWRMVVYERHSAKLFQDSYTPNTLKLQGVLAPLTLLSLVAVPVHGQMLHVFTLSMLLYFISTMPFMRFALGRDTIIALLSPFFLFIRGLSISSGALYRLIDRALLPGKK